MLVSGVLLVTLYLFENAAGLVCWECENVNSQAECLKKGRARKCRRNENMCHYENRMGGWGQKPWMGKSCKSFQACLDNHIQNLRPAWAFKGPQIQCNRYSPSSVCRCCCSTNLCNHDKTSCFPDDFDSPIYCPALSPPSNGVMRCTNRFIIGSRCSFSCRSGFIRIGKPLLICKKSGKWTPSKPPTCGVVTCPPMPKNPRFGSVSCDAGMQLGSICRYSCGKGYRLQGSRIGQCIDDMNNDAFGVWSSMFPKCIPRQCPVHRPFQNGAIRCSNKNYVDSVCEFQCNPTYRIYPLNAQTTITCERNEEWDGPMPCCSLPCPPYATMDLIFVLDSSSSVGVANWNKMKEFVTTFIGNFIISSNATQVGVIRYNRDVDRIHQILLNEFPADRDELQEAINNIPYGGSGTNTGKALNYTVDVLLKRANRKIAKDVVVLLTDGESQDNVTIASKRLRATGALVYVIPIKTKRGKINMKQIQEIAGNPDNILTEAIDKGFDALDEEFARQITSILCIDPCAIQTGLRTNF